MSVQIYTSYYPEHKSLYREMFLLTQGIKDIYPDYEKWYWNTFIEGLKKGERLYAISSKHGILNGCALLKKTPMENKISTLYVDDYYRHQGIGQALMRASLTELGKYPLMTVSEGCLNSFLPLIRQFKFRLTGYQEISDGSTEYIFNGFAPRHIKRRAIQQIRKIIPSHERG